MVCPVWFSWGLGKSAGIPFLSCALDAATENLIGCISTFIPAARVIHPAVTPVSQVFRVFL